MLEWAFNHAHKSAQLSVIKSSERSERVSNLLAKSIQIKTL